MQKSAVFSTKGRKSFIHLKCETMHIGCRSFWIKGREPLTEKLPESIESSRFAVHKARMSGEFDSRKN